MTLNRLYSDGMCFYKLVKIGTKYCYLENDFLKVKVLRTRFYERLRIVNLTMVKDTLNSFGNDDVIKYS